MWYTLPASACSAVSPETSKPQQLLLMSCTEHYSVRGQRERGWCSWAQTPSIRMMGTQPRSFPAQSAFLGLTLLAGHTPRPDRWTDGSCKHTPHDWGIRPESHLSAVHQPSGPAEQTVQVTRVLPPFARTAVIFIKQEANIETTSPIYPEAGILQTLYQMSQGDKEISFLFANNQYWALKAKQNSRKFPSNSRSSASSRVQRLH